ncbi:alpha-2,3-sialyltransferase, partial [Campylobacter molothri]|uniref:alpha-2,3-sialyltransferase n=1 Tax=Campylobacter molothri TaxID=1032242 RepID=UPI00301CA1E3|nr:alpha-2,3 sialyltransferase [Campylobacter sp. RM10538]
MNKNAVICGNGPSLKEIDYKRLPKEYDVFRCNQFYFEDKYYLGKNIKYAFFSPSIFFEQYYTAKKLIENNEYNIENIVCTDINLYGLLEDPINTILSNYFYNYFPNCIKGSNLLNNNRILDEYLKYNFIFNLKE